MILSWYGKYISQCQMFMEVEPWEVEDESSNNIDVLKSTRQMFALLERWFDIQVVEFSDKTIWKNDRYADVMHPTTPDLQKIRWNDTVESADILITIGQDAEQERIILDWVHYRDASLFVLSNYYWGTDSFLDLDDNVFKHSTKSYFEGAKAILAKLLRLTLPEDCSRITEVDYCSCCPNGELDLSLKPMIEEVLLDRKGELVCVRYGRIPYERESFYFNSIENDTDICIDIMDEEVNQTIIRLPKDSKGHIIEISSDRLTIRIDKIIRTETLDCIAKWSEDGHRVQFTYHDKDEEVIYYRSDGKEKYRRIENHSDSAYYDKRVYYYYYDYDGNKIAEEESSHRNKTGETDVELIQYDEDGRTHYPDGDRTHGYLNDSQGNWIQWWEKDANGDIIDLSIRSIHYGLGDYFLNTSYQIKHKEVRLIGDRQNKAFPTY